MGRVSSDWLMGVRCVAARSRRARLSPNLRFVVPPYLRAGALRRPPPAVVAALRPALPAPCDVAVAAPLACLFAHTLAHYAH